MLQADRVSRDRGLFEGERLGDWNLCLVLEGSFEDVAGNDLHPCREGVIRLSSPGAAHRAHIRSTTNCLVINLGGPFWRRALARLGPASPENYAFGQTSVASLIIPRERNDAAGAVGAVVQAMAGLSGAPGPAWLDAAKDEMDSLAGDVSVGRMTRRHGVTRATFARTFQRRFGLLPSEYRSLQRIRAAAGQLARHGGCLSQTALDCGYVDQSHMTNAFRLILGRSPGAIRGAQA